MEKKVVFILLVSKKITEDEELLAENELIEIISMVKRARYWKFNSVKQTTVANNRVNVHEKS